MLTKVEVLRKDEVHDWIGSIVSKRGRMDELPTLLAS